MFFFVPKIQTFNFGQKCSLSIKKHKHENMKTASHSDLPLKDMADFVYPILDLSFLLFNAVCIGMCNSLLDLILKGHISRSSAQI